MGAFYDFSLFQNFLYGRMSEVKAEALSNKLRKYDGCCYHQHGKNILGNGNWTNMKWTVRSMAGDYSLSPNLETKAKIGPISEFLAEKRLMKAADETG